MAAVAAASTVAAGCPAFQKHSCMNSKLPSLHAAEQVGCCCPAVTYQKWALRPLHRDYVCVGAAAVCYGRLCCCPYVLPGPLRAALLLLQVLLETQMEMEEENIVNRLQRQLEQLTHSYKALEAKLEQRGLTVSQLGLSPNELPQE